MASEKKPPEKKFQIGDVNASVFRNTKDDKTWFAVNLQRRFRDPQSGDWKSNSSFTGVGEITAAMEVLRQAKEYVEEQEAALVPANA